jgi:hypothetical protein
MTKGTYSIGVNLPTSKPPKWNPSHVVYQSTKFKKSLKKEKKMNWFRKKFAEWTRQAWEDARNEPMPPVEQDSINGKTSIRFTIYPASGGYVIEHYKQDRYKDINTGPSLTIVSHGDSIGTAVDHIITMEALKS